MSLQRKTSFNNIRKYILDIFFPNRCPYCGKVIKWSDTCCEKCFSKIPFISTEHCKRCGQENCICDKTEIYYDGCVSIVDYSGIVREGIINFKLDKAVNLVDVFQDNIYKEISYMTEIDKIDIVTAVPMHKLAKRKRGYNQADIIAKTVSKIISKQSNTKLLIKTNNEIAQHELSMIERAEAVNGLFVLNKRLINEIESKAVLLCDDIITTGSTLNECARVLKSNGAKKVYCLTIASTHLNYNE